MASPGYQQSMGLLLFAAILAMSANRVKGNGSNATTHLSDNFEMMTCLPSYPTIFAPASKAVTNQLCRIDSLLFLKSLNNATHWAMKMFDSSAKLPTAVLVGTTYNLGNFDECLSVKANVAGNESPSRDFIGKYCLVKLEVPLSKLTAPTNGMWAKVKHSLETISVPSMNIVEWAICVPSSCSASDLKSHLKYVLPNVDQLKSLGIPVDEVEVVVNDKLCSTVEDNMGLTTGQAVFVCAIATLLTLVCLGSLVDIALEKVSVAYKGLAAEVLLCFSLPRNLKKLFSNYKPAAALQPVSGLKVISMGLIILGHRFLINSQRAIENHRFFAEKHDEDFTIILDGTLVVDNFLFITGYLLSYYAIMESAKLKSYSSIFYIYFRRYIRLTPLYLFILAFNATWFIKLGSGPRWNDNMSSERDKCLENWWLNILYVNNIFRVERVCFAVSWYLATDMQLFILAVPSVYLLVKKPKIGKTVLGIFLLASVIIPFSVTYNYHLNPVINMKEWTINDMSASPTFKHVYIPAHMRAAPYFIGILCGYFVHYFNNNNMKFSKLQAHCIIIGAFILAFIPIFTTSIFFQKDYEYNALVAAAHVSLQRFIWTLVIFSVIIICNAEKEWYIMKFLSLRIFLPLSRLTYSAYLLHVIPQLFELSSFRTAGHFSWLNTFQLTAVDISVTYLLSFVASMILEVPLMNLEKLIFNNNGRSTRDKIKVIQNSDQKSIQLRSTENSATGMERMKKCF